MIEYKAKEEYSIDIKNYSLVARSFENKKLLVKEFIDLLTSKSIIRKVNI